MTKPSPVDEILDRLSPFDNSFNDFLRLKPAVKQSLADLLIAELEGKKQTFEYAGTNPYGSIYKSTEDGVKHGYNQAIQDCIETIKGVFK